MKAIGKLERSRGLTLYEAPIPECGLNEVLIKIKKTAICGTDLHIYKWDDWSQNTVSVPLTVGHEFVGEIVALGEGVNNYHIGQRISGEGHITCNVCRNCRTGRAHICKFTQGLGIHRNGAFAEYMVMPVRNVIVIPDRISDDIAAILDPLGNAVHTTLSFSMVGEDVLITGAGPIGCMAVQIAKASGARLVVVTDINPYRLDLAKKLGADFTINIKEAKLQDLMYTEIGLTEGFDIGLEMSGAPSAIPTLIECLRPGSYIALLGIPSKNNIEINWSQFIFKGLSIKGIYGREMFDTWYKMLALLKHSIDPSDIITHHFKYTEFEKGFNIMESGNCGKVILDWD